LKKYDFKGRYSGLFVTEKLPWKKDEIRIEKDDREVEEIHDKIVDAYKNHGYEPISVPAFYGSLEEAVGKRVEFILEKIKDGN
jgi:predicted ATPase